MYRNQKMVCSLHIHMDYYICEYLHIQNNDYYNCYKVTNEQIMKLNPQMLYSFMVLV